MADSEDYKREAITAIFGRLGDENNAILRRSLRKDYSIDLDKDAIFTLEELRLALHRILGPGGADLLMREIGQEIQKLRESAA